MGRIWGRSDFAEEESFLPNIFLPASLPSFLFAVDPLLSGCAAVAVIRERGERRGGREEIPQRVFPSNEGD